MVLGLATLAGAAAAVAAARWAIAARSRAARRRPAPTAAGRLPLLRNPRAPR